MFNITLSPIASDVPARTISVKGNVLKIDGKEYDFSVIGEGEEVEGNFPASGVIKNVGGVYHLTILHHYDSAKALAKQSLNKADYVFEIESGTVQDPIKYKQEG